MNAQEVLAQLEACGTEQARKVYQRHGAGDNLYGVSFATLNKMVKQIGLSTALAEELWESGNTDARTLALMIANPSEISRERLSSWVDDITYHMLAGYLGALTARSRWAIELIEEWTVSSAEFVQSAGYDVVCTAVKEFSYLPLERCKAFLETIERDIHAAPNRTRYSMNNALINIGTYVPLLYETSLAVATRVGKVHVDHKSTGCKTPDAYSYIQKAVAHIAAKAAKKKASKRSA